VNSSTILDQSAVEPARRFNALADPARLAILEELRHRAVCVCDLEKKLGLASNLLSYHLRILREAGLVVGTRRGRRVEYRLRRHALRSLGRALDRLGAG